MSKTPLATDIFARTMTEGFDDRRMMRAPGAFTAFFGYQPNGSQINYAPNSAVFTQDIILGSERLAPLVPRNTAGRKITGTKNTEEQRFTSLDRVFPLIEVEGDINASQLTKRLYNEVNVDSGATRADRLTELAGSIHQEHMREIARTYEYLAAQSVITGKQPAILNTTNPDLMFDWLRPAANFITVATAWSNPTSSILSDIDSACKQIRAVGRLNPDMIVFSSVDIDSFIKNDEVKNLADNRRFELIEVSTNNPVPDKFKRFIDGGFIARGRVHTPEGFVLWAFTYLDIYDDAAGDPQPYLPANRTIVASSDARCDVTFGPPERLPVDTAEMQWYQDLFKMNMLMPMMPVNFDSTDWVSLLSSSVYCDAYPSSTNKKSVTIRDQASSVFATTHTAAFVTITTTP